MSEHPYAFYLQEFLNWLKNERGSADNTVAAYQRDLEQFGQFLNKEHRCWSSWNIAICATICQRAKETGFEKKHAQP